MSSPGLRNWLHQTQGFGRVGTGTRPTDDLTSHTKDSLFLAQLQRADPTALDEESLLTAKIAETHQYARSVFHSLKKYGYLTAAGHPDTSKIDKSFVSKIAVISVPKQRELVNMLFWWEEELTRWRIIDDKIREMEELSSCVEGLEDVAVLRARKNVIPSLRRPDGSLKNEDAEPPTYSSVA